MDTVSNPESEGVKVESSTGNVNDVREKFGSARRGGSSRGRRPGAPPGPRRRFPTGGRPKEENDKQGTGGSFRSPQDKWSEKIEQLSGSTFELPPISNVEKKFSGRNRLYIGNIGNDINEQDIQEMLKPYGEVSEIFINKEKNFGFAKLDFHSNAERAKRELDGTVMKSRNLKIRFAPNVATVKVKNLTPYVSNELLHYAFSIFGEIERAIVCVDERGKPTGEGIIDFVRKGCALHAIQKCNDGCFFLTGSLQPCIVELYENVGDNDGLSDKNFPKRNSQYLKEREVGPSYALPGSFKYEYGMRWKELYNLYAEKELALKKQLEIEREKLLAQMEYAKYEHETEMLRQQLRAREMDRERQKREWEMIERQAEEERQRNEEYIRRQQEHMDSRMMRHEDEMRRRQQENQLFMQAHTLDDLISQQELAEDESLETNVTEPKAFMSAYQNNKRQDLPESSTGRTNTGGQGARGYWVNDGQTENFANKRRRF